MSVPAPQPHLKFQYFNPSHDEFDEVQEKVKLAILKLPEEHRTPVGEAMLEGQEDAENYPVYILGINEDKQICCVGIVHPALVVDIENQDLIDPRNTVQLTTFGTTSEYNVLEVALYLLTQGLLTLKPKDNPEQILIVTADEDEARALTDYVLPDAVKDKLVNIGSQRRDANGTRLEIVKSGFELTKEEPDSGDESHSDTDDESESDSDTYSAANLAWAARKCGNDAH